MSFGNPLKNIGRLQQVIVIGLMVVVMIDLSPLAGSIDFTFRIGIAVIAFIAVFLSLVASELINAQNEVDRQAQR